MPEYHGNVKVGGPAQTHELAKLMITKVAVGPMDNNAYLLRCRQTDEQVLIDAANEADTLLRLIGDGGLARVITTHRHQDHWEALAEVAARPAATTPRASRCRPTSSSTTATTSRSAAAACASSTWSATPPARSHCCTTTRTGRRTCSPATRCSPAASATPRATPSVSRRSSTT